ncbi:PREDICTED: zygote arrest protein 1 [Mandrillus leucophaeus]|uniref:zygote arrest protein 1 n=1 Tax=Mandrillus leucophaeus TaxID=9568 RepID=UPI0005F4B9FF|nr:PREDICTED: zygote arrest protein 1 [Mandrillus leucophaeus]
MTYEYAQLNFGSTCRQESRFRRIPLSHFCTRCGKNPSTAEILAISSLNYCIEEAYPNLTLLSFMIWSEVDSFRYQVDPSQCLEMKDNSGLMLVKLTYPVVQFLEQKYGYYHCKDCNIRWESAYVWCVQGTNKVYFKQFCRTCQKSYNPYRVEDITCQSCKQTRCSCPVKLRHVDPKRPHRQDLCGRCKGKRLSCDSTFSFKYII